MKRPKLLLVVISLVAVTLGGCAQNAGANMVNNAEPVQKSEDNTVTDVPEEPENAAQTDEDLAHPIGLLRQISNRVSSDDGKTYITGSIAKDVIIPTRSISYIADGDNYSELSSAVKDVVKKLADIYEESYSELVTAVEDGEVSNNFPYYANFDMGITRADTKIFSCVYSIDKFSGGAHPDQIIGAMSLNSETGKQLTLSEVFADTTTLPNLIMKNIVPTADVYADEAYFKDAVENESLFFTVDQGDVTFYFAPTEIAPHSSGVVTSTIPFFHNEELFTELALTGLDSYVSHPIAGMPYVDYFTNYDSTQELYLYNNEDENRNVTSITVAVGEEEDEQPVEDAHMITYSFIRSIDYDPVLYASVVKNDGSTDIYAWTFSMENGITFVGKFDNIGEPLYAGNSEDESYIEMISDPESFMLTQNSAAPMEYYAGENGMPTLHENQ